MIWYLIYIIAALIVISKLTSGWCYSKRCLVGKTAIITGSNSGLGYQVALDLASRGCRVIIADRADSTKSRAQIIKETNNSNVLSKYLDLSSFKSIRNFAQDIIDTEEYVHILINNAGVGTFTMQYTEDDLQRTMQINYFGHFLLTYLLLSLLKKSAPSRILFTSSIAAYMTKMNPSHLNPPSDFKYRYMLYPNSKLCVAVAAKVLSEKLKGTGVTVNSCHPGGVRSGLFLKAFKEEGGIIVLLAGFLAIIFGKNTTEGAQTLIYMAIDRQAENYTGQFFMDCCRVIQPFQIYNKQFCEQIWNKTIDYVKLQPQEIKML